MDIKCPVCREPWDIDSLHDVADEFGSFDATYRIFRTQGCGVAFASWGNQHCTREARNDAKSDALFALAELLGDDVDGYASMIEDFDL